MGVMFKIGEFARFSRVSVKMLRHYDELDLLKPAYVDPETHYRYYSAAQLPRLHRIVALKDLGFSLAQIAGLLERPFSAAQLRGMLTLRQAELEQQLAETAGQLRQVQARLAELADEDALPHYDVVVRSVGTHMMAVVHVETTLDDEAVTQAFEMLEAYVAQYQARASLPPLLQYEDAAYAEPDEALQTVAVMVPILKPVPTNGRIAICQLPAQETMACVVHSGPYHTLTHAYAALLSWIERSQYNTVGPLRELYLRFGADQEAYRLPEGYLADEAAKFITELQIAITPRQES